MITSVELTNKNVLLLVSSIESTSEKFNKTPSEIKVALTYLPSFLGHSRNM